MYKYNDKITKCHSLLIEIQIQWQEKQSAKIVSNFSQENMSVTVVSNSQMCHKWIQLGYTRPRCILIPKTNKTEDADMSSPVKTNTNTNRNAKWYNCIQLG